jgi:hypothetical protein
MTIGVVTDRILDNSGNVTTAVVGVSVVRVFETEGGGI